MAKTVGSTSTSAEFFVQNIQNFSDLPLRWVSAHSKVVSFMGYFLTPLGALPLDTNWTQTCKPTNVRTSSLGVNIALPFHLFSQKKLQFWRVNRRFQAKLAKSKNVHIIETTASIPTKFCTVIKTIKCPSWVVPTHALQIQDGGRPPSWKNRKIVISQPRF